MVVIVAWPCHPRTPLLALLRTWCEPIGLKFEQDAIGNMFLRREGTNAAAGVVAFGSHLDTVPTGGRFDGAFGVLAGMEVIRALQEAGVQTKAHWNW
jgi:N-carbamoyl-L-amino-acid hydrolase